MLLRGHKFFERVFPLKGSRIVYNKESQSTMRVDVKCDHDVTWNFLVRLSSRWISFVRIALWLYYPSKSFRGTFGYFLLYFGEFKTINFWVRQKYVLEILKTNSSYCTLLDQSENLSLFEGFRTLSLPKNLEIFIFHQQYRKPFEGRKNFVWQSGSESIFEDLIGFFSLLLQRTSFISRFV